MKVINDEKGIREYAKFIYELNQTFKNIYKDEPNYNSSYFVVKGNILFYDYESIPSLITAKINEEFFNFKDMVYYVKSSKGLFNWFSENKKDIKEIKIDEKGIIISSSSSVIDLSLKNDDVLKYNENKKIINKYTDKLKYPISKDYEDIFEKDEEGFIFKEDLSPDNIKYILDNDKKLIKMIVDFDDNKIYNSIDEVEEDHNTFSFCINKKFLIGIFYKIKKLKKGDVIDYSPIKLYVSNTEEENIFMFIFEETLKYVTIKHYFIFSDY